MDKENLDDLDFEEEIFLTAEEQIKLIKENRKKDGYKVTFKFKENGKPFEEVLASIIKSHM